MSRTMPSTTNSPTPAITTQEAVPLTVTMDHDGNENDDGMQLDVPDGLAAPPNTGQVGLQVVMQEFMQITNGLNIPTLVGARQT